MIKAKIVMYTDMVTRYEDIFWTIHWILMDIEWCTEEITKLHDFTFKYTNIQKIL